jgi:hypothetical protein
MTASRRLAAILAADVAGYSRLIGVDEEGTPERLKALRADVIDPTITAHRGRLVKTTGDGLLVEFGSVVDALRCGTEWQSDMAERNADLPPTGRIEFRIASATLSGPSPPARITGVRTASTMRRLMVQSWVTPSAPIWRSDSRWLSRSKKCAMPS